MKVRDSVSGIWIRLKRFRYRKGYGVHSPFAFNLITRVIYEKYPYYKYAELDEIKGRLPKELKNGTLNRTKVDRLLFRLVNRMQPATVIELGSSCGLTLLYLAGGKENACCHTFDRICKVSPVVRERITGNKNIIFHMGETLAGLKSVVATLASVDFLYLDEKEPDYKEAFELCLGKSGENSLFVIKGIHRSPERKEWWQAVVADGRTGITFDLYELGLVFFDKQKIKQHYIVNF